MDAKVEELSQWIMGETKWTGEQWEDIFKKGLIQPSKLCTLISQDVQFAEIVFNQIITDKYDLSTPQGNLTDQEWQELLRKYPQETPAQKFEAAYKEINDDKYSAVIGCCLAHMMEGKTDSIPTTLSQADLLELIEMVRSARQQLNRGHYMLSQFLIVGKGKVPTLCQTSKTVEDACKLLRQSICEVFSPVVLEGASPMSDITFNQVCQHETLVAYIYQIMMRDKSNSVTLNMLGVTVQEFLRLSWIQILNLTQLSMQQVQAIAQKYQHRTIPQLQRDTRYYLDSPTLANYIYQKLAQPELLEKPLFERLEALWRYRQDVCDIL